MNPETIIPYLMFVADQVRIYHWQAKRYAEHKALGKYYDDLSSLTDDIAEVMLGESGDVKPSFSTSLRLGDHAEGAAEKLLKHTADELASWANLSPDVLNLRDDLLAKTHRTLYLLKLS